MSKAFSANVFPDVTVCPPELSAPVIKRREFVVSVIAKCVALPLPVTDAPEIADTVTFRPLVSPSVGADMLMLVVLPSVYVDVASAYDVGS
jgi:hypothetical protein